MRTVVSWIEGPWSGRLAVTPRPLGGDWLEEEIPFWRREGVDIVVSLLTPKEIRDKELEQEPAVCRANDIEFFSFPIVDHSVPSSVAEVRQLAGTLDGYLHDGKSVVIHCQAGLGRSPLIAACVFALAGVAPKDAFYRISMARGFPVQDTEEQWDWVVHFAQTQTGQAIRQ